MSKADEPAFPEKILAKNVAVVGGIGIISSKGLTKREYFAAEILSGMLSHPEVAANKSIMCSVAVEYADALLATLERKGEG